MLARRESYHDTRHMHDREPNYYGEERDRSDYDHRDKDNAGHFGFQHLVDNRDGYDEGKSHKKQKKHKKEHKHHKDKDGDKEREGKSKHKSKRKRDEKASDIESTSKKHKHKKKKKKEKERKREKSEEREKKSTYDSDDWDSEFEEKEKLKKLEKALQTKKDQKDTSWYKLDESELSKIEQGYNITPSTEGTQNLDIIDEKCVEKEADRKLVDEVQTVSAMVSAPPPAPLVQAEKTEGKDTVFENNKDIAAHTSEDNAHIPAIVNRKMGGLKLGLKLSDSSRALISSGLTQDEMKRKNMEDGEYSLHFHLNVLNLALCLIFTWCLTLNLSMSFL